MEDFAWLAETEASVNNGITFYVGSLGSSASNDVLAILHRFKSRVHFLHGRTVQIEADGFSFHESDHLDGNVDLVDVLRLVMREQAQRKERGEELWQIPVRPDHGHVLLNDCLREHNLGHSAIGRLKVLLKCAGLCGQLNITVTKQQTTRVEAKSCRTIFL